MATLFMKATTQWRPVWSPWRKCVGKQSCILTNSVRSIFACRNRSWRRAITSSGSTSPAMAHSMCLRTRPSCITIAYVSSAATTASIRRAPSTTPPTDIKISSSPTWRRNSKGTRCHASCPNCHRRQSVGSKNCSKSSRATRSRADNERGAQAWPPLRLELYQKQVYALSIILSKFKSKWRRISKMYTHLIIQLW